MKTNITPLDLFNSTKSKKHWKKISKSTRNAVHKIIEYPAMMVPEMQGELIGKLAEQIGETPLVIDPFLGSGTTLVEAMRKGLPFVGQDLNPLAVLISKTKAGPFKPRLLKSAYSNILSSCKLDHSQIDVEFNGMLKWFHKEVLIDLCKLRRAIIKVKNLWVRRVMWVALAETIRITSNSRMSTYKLHIKSKENLLKERPSPINVFKDVSTNVIKLINEEIAFLKDKGFIVKGKYINSIKISYGDSSQKLPGNKTFDLLVTSPPYGDNKTTVPYGQFSYLPLQFITLSDIDSNIDYKLLDTINGIDSRSLGGHRKGSLLRAKKALNESKSLKAYIDKLKKEPIDRAQRVLSFASDLRETILTIVNRMASNSRLVWTVGNRTVGGKSVPLDKIIIDMFAAQNVFLVGELKRTIHSKRMATRNSFSKTMDKEKILIFQSRR